MIARSRPISMAPVSNAALEARITMLEQRIAKLGAIIRQLLDVPTIKHSGVVTQNLEGE